MAPDVRILCVGAGKFGTGEKVRSFPIDLNALFTEVSFDLRLICFERLEREQRLRSLEFTGHIREDQSYAKVFTLIPMANGWPQSGVSWILAIKVEY